MNFNPPRIAPPAPNFPHKFNDSVPETVQSTSGWPKSEGASTEERNGAVDWKLKDDKELYILALEDRLRSLEAANLSSNASSSGSSSSKPDSGYQSSHPAFSPLSAPHDRRYFEHELEEPDEPTEFDEDEHGEREGHALLRNSVPPATTPLVDLPPTTEGDEPSFGQEESTPPKSEEDQQQEQHFKIIPPTPLEARVLDVGQRRRESSSDEDEPESGEAITYRMPAELLEQSGVSQKQQQRISFSGSVRISGGIKNTSPKKSKRKRRAPPNASDLFAPTTSDDNSPRIPSASSLSSSRQGSRSASPSSSGFEIHSRNLSTGSLSYLHNQSGYSSTATTSGMQSRSSSPCSSIYAPLQPPSQTCPNPLNVRPLNTTNRVPPKKKLSFRDYLRGISADTALDPDDDESEEEVARGYRELVEEQRRKKAKFEHGRRPHRTRGGGALNGSSAGSRERSKSPGGVWSRIKEIFVAGGAVSTLGSGGARGGMGGGLYGATGVTPGWTGTESGLLPPNTPPTRGRGRTRTARRQRSSLAISHLSDEDPDATTTSATPSTESTSHQGDGGEEVIKTPMDVMFGKAPARYFKLSWWIFKAKGAWQALDCLGVSRREKEESNDPSTRV